MIVFDNTELSYKLDSLNPFSFYEVLVYSRIRGSTGAFVESSSTLEHVQTLAGGKYFVFLFLLMGLISRVSYLRGCHFKGYVYLTYVYLHVTNIVIK